MGYELLSKWDSTRPYAEAALYHHLWYDEKGGYPREYTHKGNDNAILYQILTCADCLGAATDSVGRLITVEREQLFREVFGKNVELVLYLWFLFMASIRISVYCSSFQGSVRLAWPHCRMHKFHSAYMFISLIY